MRPRSLIRTICAVSLLTLTAACRPLTADGGKSDPAPSIGAEDAARATPARRRVAPVTDCPIAPSKREDATGRELRATTLTYRTRGFDYDVVLSAESLARLPEALSTEQFLDMEQAFFKGGFAWGGAYAQIALENTTDTTMSVYDIRPVNIVVECMPLAALVIYGNEGGDPAQMVFNMDADAPIARSITDDGHIGRPYFETTPSIDLEKHEKETFLLRLNTDVGAYTFDIMISYEWNGQKSRTILRNGFVPFRVAADLCPSEEAGLALPSADLAHLTSLRYQNIRRRGPNWTIVPQSPEDRAADCTTR